MGALANTAISQKELHSVAEFAGCEERHWIESGHAAHWLDRTVSTFAPVRKLERGLEWVKESSRCWCNSCWIRSLSNRRYCWSWNKSSWVHNRSWSYWIRCGTFYLERWGHRIESALRTKMPSRAHESGSEYAVWRANLWRATSEDADNPLYLRAR